MVGSMQDNKPGFQHVMTGDAAPLMDTLADGRKYKGVGKLQGKNVLITGADSGIGASFAIIAAYEGASLLLHYYPSEEKDKDNVAKYLQENAPNTKFEFVGADLSKKDEVSKVADKAKSFFNGSVHVLFNNHGTQNEVEDITDLADDQWVHVFDTNIHAIFRLTKAIIPLMPWGGSIINNASINPFVGHPKLVDYTSTKGAIVGFTRALSNQIVKERGIRVNAVCPGPILTPLVVATMGKESMETFGVTTAIGRCGQPIEVATCVMFLACAESTYVSAQMIHCNGGAPY